MKDESCEKCVKSLALVNIGGNSFIAVLKVFLGIAGGSHALFADGIHSFGDVFGSVMMVISLKIADRPRDSKYPYGYGKVEFLAACIIYISLFFVGCYILTSAIHHIISGVHINPDMVTLLGALISLVANELMYRQSICCGTQLNSPSMIANAHEKRADMLSSAVVLVGIVGAKLGLDFLDPLAAIVVSFLIFKLCYESLKKAVQGLMDSALPPEFKEEVIGIIRNYPDLEVSEIRAREVGQKVDIEIVASIDRNKLLKEVETIKSKIKNDILKDIERVGNVEIYFSAKK